MGSESPLHPSQNHITLELWDQHGESLVVEADANGATLHWNEKDFRVSRKEAAAIAEVLWQGRNL